MCLWHEKALFVGRYRRRPRNWDKAKELQFTTNLPSSRYSVNRMAGCADCAATKCRTDSRVAQGFCVERLNSPGTCSGGHQLLFIPATSKRRSLAEVSLRRDGQWTKADRSGYGFGPDVAAHQPLPGISRRTTFADWTIELFAFSRQAARSSILKGFGTTGLQTSVPASSLSL